MRGIGFTAKTTDPQSASPVLHPQLPGCVYVCVSVVCLSRKTHMHIHTSSLLSLTGSAG